MIKNIDDVKLNLLTLLQAQHERKFKTKELARALKIAPGDYNQFRNYLRQWAAAGDIAMPKSNTFRAVKISSLITGKLHVKTHGYGFLLTPEGEEDIFISLKNMGIALDGDEVKVQLFAGTAKKRPEGKVVEVIERRRQYIVGTLKKGKHYYFLVPDDLKITRDVYVHESGLNGAKVGQKVAVEIDEWEDELLNPEGHVAKIIGFPGDPGVDVLSVAASFDLPMGFPESVEKEARTFKNKLLKKDLKDRLDLRKQVCFTIDPEDAKDFDDAVSLRKLDNGNMELGVHIADVSHYVKEGGALDQEALARGTSVYLVDRVVPMLPEWLSNELCSLKPQVDRLAFSCIMELSPSGDVVSYRIAETVIHSNCRFSYEEVQAFFEGETDLPGELAEPLDQMYALHKTLRHKRIVAGGLEFETPEPKIRLDDKGVPVDIVRKETLESMQMIEEFMLLANKTISQHVDTLKTEDDPPPFVYRVHEKPTPEKMAAFTEFSAAMGYQARFDGKVTSKKLSSFLRKINNQEERVIIESVMLRSLMKARYDTDNLGHFGLNFKHYSHFTSPIRRYPDLIAHRMLKYYAKTRWHEELRMGLTGKLDDICQRASACETTAQEAERASIKMKQVEFMASRLGEEFDGMISGVVHFGIFVEITAYLVEGLVHISDLQDDFYTFDDKAMTLEGTSGGEKFRMGDPVRVKIVRVDRDERIIDMVLVKKYTREDLAKDKKSEHKKAVQTKQAPKKNKNSSTQKRNKKRPEKGKTQQQDKSKGESLKERSVTKRQLTRADDNRPFFTTMRQTKSRNTASTRGGSVTNSNRPTGSKRGGNSKKRAHFGDSGLQRNNNTTRGQGQRSRRTR